MSQAAPAVPSPSSPTADLLRLVRRVLTLATVDPALAHTGEPCSQVRARCPDQRPDDPINTLELLRSGRIVAWCPCHKGVHAPDDPGYDDLRRCFP